jgi:hypothetical protein
VLSTKRAYALALVLESNPHISLLVRSLIIKGDDGSQRWRMSDSLRAVIPEIAPKLTRLRTLRVQHLILAYSDLKSLSALIHNFSALQALHLSSVIFNRFRDFAALIVAHPFLEYLDLGKIWWTEAVTAASHWENVFQECPDLRSRLRCISLDYTSLNVIDWISSYYRVLPVHKVTQSIISAYYVPQLARFLQNLGSSLEHLTFCIYSTRYGAESLGMEFLFVEVFISH